VNVLALHEWDVTPSRAEEIQEELRKKVSLRPSQQEVRLVAGADVSYRKDAAVAAVVVCSYPEMRVVGEYRLAVSVSFPYIPGLFAFREGPALLACFTQVAEDPDLIFFNGHGIAHPRGCGLASHLGILLDRPSVGVARTLLYGRYAEPPAFSGASTFVHNEDGDTVGHCLRLSGGDVLFVSPGHRIDLKGALSFTLSCLREADALPAPLLYAHRLTRREGN